MAHSALLYTGGPKMSARGSSRYADLYGAPVGSAASLLRAARVRPPSAGRERPSSAGRMRPSSAGPMSARATSAGRLPAGLREHTVSASTAMLPRSMSEARIRSPSPASPDKTEGFAGDATMFAMEDQFAVLGMTARTETQKPSSGKAVLQEQVLVLKEELHESEAEAKRYRQRMVHLEGDVQGKVQWMLHWERQMALKAGIGEPADNGLNGLGWSAWDTFIGRGEVESQKTQRLLARTVNMDWHRAINTELLDAVKTESIILEAVESELKSEDAENSRLSSALRRRDNHNRKMMKTAEAHRLECLLATQEAELSKCVTSEINQQKELTHLEEELHEQRHILDEMPSQKMKRKLQQATKHKDGLHEEYEEEMQKRLQQTLQGEWEDYVEMNDLQKEECCVDDYLAKGEEELRELASFLEESRHVEMLQSKAEKAASQEEASQIRAYESRWREEALRFHRR